MSEEAVPKELLILAGQSNAVGRSVRERDTTPEQREAPGAVVWTHKKGWLPLRYQSGYQYVGLGPEVGLAQAWQEATGRPPALVKLGKGGASLAHEFNPEHGKRKLGRMIAHARLARQDGAPDIRGLIWVQGERDAGVHEKSLHYSERFTGMVETVRTRLDCPGLPVVCALLSADPEQLPWQDAINAAFRDNGDPLIGCIETHDLEKADGIHYTGAALYELGRRAGRELARLCEGQE